MAIPASGRNILITGATGNIGSALVERLTYKRVRHRAMVRNPDQARHLESKYTTLVEGDFNDPISLRIAVEGCHALFLLSPASPEQVDFQTTAVDAAAHANVQHIVKVSALGTRESSPVNLLQWHASIERDIRKSGLTYTFLHPHIYMQNLLAQAHTIRSKGTFYGSWGDASVAIIDARDVADVAAEVLTSRGHDNTTYTLTGPEAVTTNDVAEALSEAVGRAITFVDMPPDEHKHAMIENGYPAWLAHDFSLLATHYRKGKGADVSPAVKQLTGQPGRSISDFASDYADAFRSGAKVPA